MIIFLLLILTLLSVLLGACLLVLLYSVTLFADAVTVSSVLSLDEQVRFKQKFYDAMPFKDLETAFYSVFTLKTMKAEVPPTQVSRGQTFNKCFFLVFIVIVKIGRLIWMVGPNDFILTLVVNGLWSF